MSVSWEARDAKTPAQRDLKSVDNRLPRQAVAKPVCKVRQVAIFGVGLRCDELVPAKAGDRFARADTVPQARRDRPQDAVAKSMTTRIVDFAEAVQIDIDDSDALSGNSRVLEFRLEAPK